MGKERIVSDQLRGPILEGKTEQWESSAAERLAPNQRATEHGEGINFDACWKTAVESLKVSVYVHSCFLRKTKSICKMNLEVVLHRLIYLVNKHIFCKYWFN